MNIRPRWPTSRAIRSPFDGVIVRRNVDPGSFVQNASSGSSEPLISVARTDLVTISAKFPDNVAMLIRRGTPATIELDDLANAAISTSVVRFSPSISNSDRTMAVEADLFNGSRREFMLLAARTVAAGLSPLGGGSPLGAMIANIAADDYFSSIRKGPDDRLPGPAHADQQSAFRLLPGMTGMMRLQLSRFGKSYVVPSSAVIRAAESHTSCWSRMA